MQLRSRLVQFLSAGHFIAFVCATSLSVTSQLPFSGSETNVKPHVPSSSTLSFGDTLPESTLGPTTTAPDKQDGGLAQNLNHVTTNATTTTISATTTTTTTTATSAIVTTTNTTSATATASVTITGKSEDPPKKANTNATIASAEPASGAATKKPTQAPSSGSGPPVSTTTQAESLRSHNVSITTVFSVRTIDFRVGSMIEATRKRPMARVMANALEKIGYANFTSTDVGLVTTTRMLREQTTFGESLVHNRQIVNTSQRSSSAKKIVTVARWYPCGFGRRRCVSPDKCVHSDTGAVCAPQEDNPSLDASNFISYWALQLSVDCRCVSMIDSDLHKTKFPLDATFGPPPKWGRLSAMKNPFPRCKNRTGTRIASGDGLPCWCGVQLLICHALQSCVEHAEHPHLSRCESSDKILPWARKQQLKPCPTDEGKVYEGKSLCTCVKGQAYCVRGQRCVKNTPDGLPTCQSPYNVCPNDGPSMEDVCYCKWRACAYGEQCVVRDKAPSCVPRDSVICPHWYHPTLLSTQACIDNVLCDFSKNCWWWGCGFLRSKWCPRDWPFMCANVMCVAHPDVCIPYNGLRGCPCDYEATRILIPLQVESPDMLMKLTPPGSGSLLRDAAPSTSNSIKGRRLAQIRRVNGAEDLSDASLHDSPMGAALKLPEKEFEAWLRRLQEKDDPPCNCEDGPLRSTDPHNCCATTAAGRRSPYGWPTRVNISVQIGTQEQCASCSNGIQNGDEEDVDCGGLFCVPCDLCVFRFGCVKTRRGNSKCDQECNNAVCGYDNGDCEVENQLTCRITRGCNETLRLNGVCEEVCNTEECYYDEGNCLHKGCTDFSASNFDKHAIVEDYASCEYLDDASDQAPPAAALTTLGSHCSRLTTSTVCSFYVNCSWDPATSKCSEKPEQHSIILLPPSEALYSDLRAHSWATSETGYAQTYHVTTHFNLKVTEEEANSCLGLTVYSNKSAFNAALREALTSEITEAQSKNQEDIAEILAAYAICYDRRLQDFEMHPFLRGMFGALLGVITAAVVCVIQSYLFSLNTLKCRMGVDFQACDSTQNGDWRVSVIYEV